MSREKILSADDQAPETERGSAMPGYREEEDLALRPKRMAEMVGQQAVYERLKIAVDAAMKRNEPLGHILLDGPPGLGKTTFATCIPRDLDVALQIASGATLAAPKDLLPYLTNAEEGSVLFIDEIHRLPKAVEEFMYPAMEDFRVDITLGEGMNARTVNMTLAVVFAMTGFSLLVAAFARTREQIIPLGLTVIMLVCAVGGCWWPIFMEPPWLQRIAHAVPTAWAMDGISDLILRERSLAGVAPVLGVLFAYGAACLAVGARLYRLSD